VIDGNGGNRATRSGRDETLQYRNSSSLADVGKSKRRTLTLILAAPIGLPTISNFVGGMC